MRTAGPKLSTRRSAMHFAVAGALLGTLAFPLPAQTRVLRLGGDSAAAAPSRVTDAAALLARGDSSEALEVLAAEVRLRPADGATWHRHGMLAWAMAGMGQRYARTLNDASGEPALARARSSLGTAASAAPDSARFAFDLGRFMLAGTVPQERSAALRAFDDALSAARRVSGDAAFSALADTIATLFWTRYDRVASRTVAVTGRHVALPGELADVVLVDTRNFVVPGNPPSWPGQLDYQLAEELLRAATAADSANALVRRHRLRLLVDRERWAELQVEARRQQRLAPWDAWPWLAEGLAAHRSDGSGAEAAFRQALAAAGAADSARLDRMTRFLPPADAARLERMQPVERAAFEQLAWRLVDPLWSTPPNELRVEFLARVAYAELRWTGDAAGVASGADTDAGLILVRNGPPSRVISYVPDRRGFVHKRWIFPDRSWVMLRSPIDGGPLSLPDVPAAAPWRTGRGASWQNVPVMRTLDTLPALAARFRADDGGADVYVAARVPVGRLLAGMELARAPLQTDLWVATPRGERVSRDSSRTTLGPPAASATEMKVWRKRMPAGAYMYRVEALQPETGRGARGAAVVSTPAGVAFPLRGFGVSDLLVAEQVQRRVDPPQRWTDYNMVPNAGVLKRGQSFALLWESYELTATAAGTNRYAVQLAVLPLGARRTADFTLRVMGGSAPLGAARSRDKLAFGFARELPARPVQVDDVMLDLGRTEPGTYLLRVTLTDLETRRTDTRETVVTVTP